MKPPEPESDAGASTRWSLHSWVTKHYKLAAFAAWAVAMIGIALVAVGWYGGRFNSS